MGLDSSPDMDNQNQLSLDRVAALNLLLSHLKVLLVPTRDLTPMDHRNNPNTVLENPQQKDQRYSLIRGAVRISTVMPKHREEPSFQLIIKGFRQDGK